MFCVFVYLYAQVQLSLWERRALSLSLTNVLLIILKEIFVTVFDTTFLPGLLYFLYIILKRNVFNEFSLVKARNPTCILILRY